MVGGGTDIASRPLSRSGMCTPTSGCFTMSKGTGPPTPCFMIPRGMGKNAPARVRANPVSRPHSRLSSRPPTAEDFNRTRSSLERGPSPLNSDNDMSFFFEEQYMKVGTASRSTPTPFPRAMPSSPNTMGTLSRAGSPAPTSATGAVGRPIHIPYRPDLRLQPSSSTSPVQTKPMTFKDYQFLSEACQRAGKARVEGHAYYKMGEALAQKRETLRQSLPYFQKYLNICRRLNDLQGEGKALNCLGIVHQEIGNDEDLDKALDYHQQHSDIADAAGVFIANTNLGLIRGVKGDLSRSIEHHKQALQFAVRAQDKQAEALALANLSLIGRSQGDFTTAKVCVERNLELSSALKDNEASTDAYEQLGMLSSDKKDWNSASDYLLQALDLSEKQGSRVKSNNIRCKLGFVNGTMRMEEHFRNIAKLMGAKNEKRRPKSAQEPG
eukprot:TRINITY_DN3935_c0_g2_i1.p1 TRINITY_DN3935_c0_g2~~TRINITY_DN3935_c0_g2_i1.p1  ORF type:complete len:468 (+),score=75.54 TRINITY_DN3935_c0_g2_i1:90-1406(+)